MVTHITFIVPVWDLGVMLFIGEANETKLFINKKYDYKVEDFTNIDDFISNDCQGCTFEMKVKNKNKHYIKRYCVYLPRFIGTVHDFAVLNHELLHLVCRSLRCIGVEMNEESEESFAYYYDYASEYIYKELEKRKLCTFKKDKK